MKKSAVLLLLFCFCSASLAEDTPDDSMNGVSFAIFPLASMLSNYSVLPMEINWVSGGKHRIKTFYHHSFNHNLSDSRWMGLGYHRLFSKQVDSAWFQGINFHYLRPIRDDEYVNGGAVTYEIGREKTHNGPYMSFSLQFGVSAVAKSPSASSFDDYATRLTLTSMLQGIGWRF